MGICVTGLKSDCRTVFELSLATTSLLTEQREISSHFFIKVREQIGKNFLAQRLRRQRNANFKKYLRMKLFFQIFQSLPFHRLIPHFPIFFHHHHHPLRSLPFSISQKIFQSISDEVLDLEGRIVVIWDV